MVRVLECGFALLHTQTMVRALTLRLLHIVSVAIRHGYGCVWRRDIPGPERLRMAFEELGGSFLKFGQMLALQPDILSIEYCNALFNLLDRVPPFSFEDVERTFREELGRAPDDIFDTFERSPMAAASIGQVHIATLLGKKLAVKVQRPTVEKDFAGDIWLMSACVKLIRRLRLKFFYWMIEPMSEFVAWTREELDYRQEARYARQLRRNCEANLQEHVPEIWWDLTTRRLLVMEFLDGVTVLGYLRALERDDCATIEQLDSRGFDSHVVASRIIDNFLGDVFRHGMFHADLHPANLMILPGNVVGYIDFGITGTISAYSRRNLIALTLAYTRGDVDAMCEAFFRVSSMDDRSNPELFRQGLLRFSKEWYQVERKERRLRKNFTLVMLDMLRLSRQTGVWPERDVIKYIRSAIAIDGLITRFAPSFDVGRYLENACDRYLKWHARRTLLTYETLSGFALSGGRLAQTGALRAASFIDRVMNGELKVEALNFGGAPPAGRQTIYLCSALFAAACVLVTGREEPRLGINLFTAEALFAVSLAGKILHSLGSLTGIGKEQRNA